MTTRDMIHETPVLLAAAMLAHAANREYCRVLGDDSQVEWHLEPQWQQDSIMAGVIAINENPDISPEELHERWLSLKAEEGWVYGEKKDPDARTHPCMVPYTDLSEDQRFKDTLFGAVVRAVLFGISGANFIRAGQVVEDSRTSEERGRPVRDMLEGMDAEELKGLGLMRTFGEAWEETLDCPDCHAVIEIVDGTPQVTGRQNSDEEAIGQPGDAKNPVTASEEPLTARERAIEKLLGEHKVKGVMGATSDGVGGVMVFYHDGSTARYVHGHGWSAKEPVPDTYAALFAKVDKAMAEAKKAEE